MTQFKMLLPLVVVAAGFLLFGLRRRPSTPGRPTGPALPLPKSLKARQQFQVGAAINLSKYPGRPGARQGGRAAFIKDWSAANLKSTIGFLMPHVRGAISSTTINVDFKARANWLLRAMEDFLRRK